MRAAKNERELFDEWWPTHSLITGQVAAWEAWKARALLDDPTCLDCEECEGTGTHSPSLDPQWDVPCPSCKGDRVASWV